MRSRAIILVAAALLGAAAANAETVTGPAAITDGDTITVRSEKVRLFGIDAPELAQRCVDAKGRNWNCGQAARDRLARLIGSAEISCRGDERDAYGRLLGTCTASGRDVNAEMVRAGAAWAFVKYSSVYVEEEQEARQAHRGVFAAENMPPWEFRAEKWQGSQETAESDRMRDCPIKGNVSAKGERIYHMPWQHDYARVKIDEAKGERWFCDEGAAERAGWRRAVR